jgi:hypothetical protein
MAVDDLIYGSDFNGVWMAVMRRRGMGKSPLTRLPSVSCMRSLGSYLATETSVAEVGSSVKEDVSVEADEPAKVDREEDMDGIGSSCIYLTK